MAGTTQHHHAPQREARGARTGLLAGVAVVVVVLIGVTVFLLLQGPGTPLRPATASRTQSHSPAPSAKPSPSATTPATLAGTWAGIVRQPPTDTYHVSVTLKAHSAQGTVSYSGTGFGCSGILTLQHATSTKLTMNQNVTTGTCENGNVTISVTSASSVWFSFRSAGPIAAGKLTRS